MRKFTYGLVWRTRGRDTGDNGGSDESGAADFIYGEAGNDLIVAQGGDDVVDGGADDDTVLGGAGNDMLAGGTGNDQVQGGSGDDSLDGGGGSDILFGGSDFYLVDDAADGVTEHLNEGTDTVRSSVTFTQCANVENLALSGDAANAHRWRAAA